MYQIIVTLSHSAVAEYRDRAQLRFQYHEALYVQAQNEHYVHYRCDEICARIERIHLLLFTLSASHIKSSTLFSPRMNHADNAFCNVFCCAAQ